MDFETIRILGVVFAYGIVCAGLWWGLAQSRDRARFWLSHGERFVTNPPRNPYPGHEVKPWET